MKKILILALLLTLSLVIQAQAASTSSSQGVKAGQVDAIVQDNQVGNAVQTQEQNQVANQREDTQIQTQERNAIQTQNSGMDKTNKGMGEQKGSQITNAVQSMLQIADRNGGIGQQVKIIAQNQNQNQLKLEQNLEKIQSRGKFVKFFIGPNYNEIEDAQKTLEQNREQIRQLNQIRTQLSNQGDQQQLTEQIRILEQANQEIEILIGNAQKEFSLFGWLNKILS